MTFESTRPPSEQLDPKALRMWRISEAIQCTLILAFCIAITSALIYLADDIPFYLSILPVVFALILWAISVLVVPTFRWRNWRYEIGDLEVDLQRGVWTIIRTRVPMARIQHVETRRGPLEQRFGLATVILFTAAGANQIPALSLPIADNVRDRIAALANTHDDV